MEYLDIVDESGQPTGRTVERKYAHENGIRHRTSHVWLYRKRNEHIEILLQKRCDTKDSFPGCYDISSAGHIPAGVDFIPSAVRELKEELGIDVEDNELIYSGDRFIEWDDVFYDRPFHDRQVSRVFVLLWDWEETEFFLQKEEVSEVRWMELENLLKAVKDDAIPHCICLEELEMIKKTIMESI